jgi:SAM-dependent methyltransferase
MDSKEMRNFQQLFKEGNYILLKNYLYNYLLRRRAVKKSLVQEVPAWILEVGSGISPLITNSGRTVYSDLSFDAVSLLKRSQRHGYYVVADGEHLPFKSNVFSHAICSEVLEHIEHDRQALEELARILNKDSGCLIITVPHRKRYFANDDLFVKHYRRYELAEIKNRLRSAGFKPIYLAKILGPLEKITMSMAVYFYSIIQGRKLSGGISGTVRSIRLMELFVSLFKWTNLFYKGFVWLDAKMMPLSLSSVILIKSRTHLKNRILVQDRDGAEFKTAGNLLVVEDLKRGTNKDIGPKDIFEMGSNILKETDTVNARD